MMTLEQLIEFTRRQAQKCDAESDIWMDILMHLIELDQRRQDDERRKMLLNRKIEK